MKFFKMALSASAAAALLLSPLNEVMLSEGNSVFALESVKELTDSDTGIRYNVTDGSVTVTGCDKKAAVLKIPSRINGIPVKTIGKKAFAGHSKLKTVSIAEGISAIEQDAFNSCRLMTSVTLPETLSSISSGAFDGCVSLKSAVIPEGVKSVDERVFRGCSSLERVTLPEGITEIKEQGFNGCGSLKNVKIPSTVCYIGKQAFASCGAMQYADIPYGVIGIGEYAFERCQELKSVSLPESLLYIEKGAFQYSSALQNAKLPESLISIGSFAFRDTGIKKFVIPDNVEYVGTLAYPPKAECQVEDGVKYIGKWVVDCENTGNGLLEVREGTAGIAEFSLSLLSDMEYSVELPSTVKHICHPVFYSSSVYELNISEDNPYFCTDDSVIFSKDMTRLIMYPEFKTDESYDIPDTVTEICENAFQKRGNLKSVSIPDSVKYIGAHAFEKSGLTEITLPENLIEIGEYAFSGLSNLKKSYRLNIPESVTKVGYKAFADSDFNRKSISGKICIIDNWAVIYDGSSVNDKKVEIKDKIRGIADKTFMGTDCQEIILPDSVEYIGDSAFLNCSELKKINLSKKLLSIDDKAFSGCQKLEALKIPESVIHVGSNSFSGCVKAVEDIDGIQYMDTWAVYADTSIKKAVLRSGTRGIAESVFDSHTQLTNVKLPGSLRFINSQAFAFCISLKDITLSKNLQTIDMGAFAYCISLKDISVPENTMYIDYAAFAECELLAKIKIYSDDCYIHGGEDTLPPNAIIYGHKGSAAESYAEKSDRVFITLDKTNDSVRGDVNADGNLDNADLKMLENWLNGTGELNDWKAGDLSQDGSIDVFDLCAMRRELLN